jgi:hypothetical protein
VNNASRGTRLSRARKVFLRQWSTALADFVESRMGSDRPFDVVRWRERAGSTTDLTDLRQDLQRPLVVPSGPVAETWCDSLKLAFGLVDGSLLPAGTCRTRGSSM